MEKKLSLLELEEGKDYTAESYYGVYSVENKVLLFRTSIETDKINEVKVTLEMKPNEKLFTELKPKPKTETFYEVISWYNGRRCIEWVNSYEYQDEEITYTKTGNTREVEVENISSL